MGITFQVLEAVEKAESTLNLNELSRALNVERTALEGIIEFWVRKGKIMRLNESVCASADCSGCGAACPMKSKLPRGVVVYQASSSEQSKGL